MTERNFGKLGALPYKEVEGLHDLSTYLTGALPTPPSHLPTPSLSTWGMLGNDAYGDCGIAGFIHGDMAAEWVTHQSIHLPLAQQAVDYYLNYTGGQDSGVVLSDFLRYVHGHQNGLIGHKVDVFVPVAVRNHSLIKSACEIVDFVYTGITCTNTMQADFANHRPWTAESFLRGHVVGGHCVPIIGYDASGVTIVTWGQTQLVTWEAWDLMATEAWAVLTSTLDVAGGDWHGINLASIRADLKAL